MLEKVKNEEPNCKVVVELTPDELIIAARKLEIAASKAQPGQEVLLNFTTSIVLKYDPKISVNTAEVRRNLAGTAISSTLEQNIMSNVNRDEGNTPSH